MTERVPLHDEHGREVASYLLDQRLGRPCADMFDAEPGIPMDRVVAAVFARLAGWAVAGATVDVGEALVAAGAIERRRAIVQQHDLAALPGPAVPAGIEIVALAHTAHQLLPAFLAAFPQGHLDRAPESSDADELADLQRVLDGDEVGPLMPQSRVAVSAAGSVVAAVTVNDRDGTPPLAGPWLSYVFRDPQASPPGTGAALVAATLAALRDDGAAGAGIAVTAGNPAQRVYERLGFRTIDSGMTVVLPDQPVNSAASSSKTAM
jgi:GNAT superfamily N-acetyltransferase